MAEVGPKRKRLDVLGVDRRALMLSIVHNVEMIPPDARRMLARDKAVRRPRRPLDRSIPRDPPGDPMESIICRICPMP